MPALAPSSLEPYLRGCGYDGDLLQPGYRFASEEGEAAVDYAGFAHWPPDARSACLLLADSRGDLAATARRYTPLGAAVMLFVHQGYLHWFQPRQTRPEFVQRIPPDQIGTFFRRNTERFRPSRIYHAKTWGRFDPGFQLDFVDAGLMPVVERQIGHKLGALVERVVRNLLRVIPPGEEVTADSGGRLFQMTFWLLAAKILRDKGVPSFRGRPPADANAVFDLVGAHYRAALPLRAAPHEMDAVSAAAAEIMSFSHLGHVTAESLAYVYENTLISKATRKQLGTHSTPSYLVDYIVWQLSPWVAAMEQDERRVFEPASGHSAFLVAALRLLRELWDGPEEDDRARSEYLRQRLRGMEVDDFAREISRLSLTIADVPRHNGWQIDPGDMFVGDRLERRARECSILLANPPFERFEDAYLKRLAGDGVDVQLRNKAAEMFRRTLPNLPPGGIFGIVAPQSILNGRASEPLRRTLIRDFEIAELCLLPDKVFAFADPESVVMIGRRVVRRNSVVRYRRVREDGFEAFKESYEVSSDRVLPQSQFAQLERWSLRVPELQEVWTRFEYGPKLVSLARVGNGLDYINKDRLNGRTSVADAPFTGSVPGFFKVEPDYCTHELPRERQMSISADVVGVPRSGTRVGVGQVLLNYGMGGRGPWRLKAVIDRAGHAVTSRFLTVRPREGVSLEYLWAICNSPLGNAYVWAHGTKRDVLNSMVRQLPVPEAPGEGVQKVENLVRKYFDLLKPAGFFGSEPDLNAAARLHLQIDAEVLGLYRLDAELEWALLQVFRNQVRRGVPFSQVGYPNNDFGVPLPLKLTLSLARIRALSERDGRSPAEEEELAALQGAIDAFERSWHRRVMQQPPAAVKRRRSALKRILTAARRIKQGGKP